MLRGCDVMLKDIQDSNRLQKDIRLQNELGGPKDVQMIIISKEFWKVQDSMQDGEEIPEQFKQIFEEYSTQFAERKAGRELNILPSYGTV